jgi:uncharacterized membrane protein YeaQ/YmgE (transglycosylase-associated protein family)
VGTIGSIIVLIIVGAIVGALARLVVPGRQAYGMVVTIVLGIVGVLIGYWLAGVLGVAHTKGIDWIRWIISIGVAAIFSFAFAAFTSRRRPAL